MCSKSPSYQALDLGLDHRLWTPKLQRLTVRFAILCQGGLGSRAGEGTWVVLLGYSMEDSVGGKV